MVGSPRQLGLSVLRGMHLPVAARALPGAASGALGEGVIYMRAVSTKRSRCRRHGPARATADAGRGTQRTEHRRWHSQRGCAANRGQVCWGSLVQNRAGRMWGTHCAPTARARVSGEPGTAPASFRPQSVPCSPLSAPLHAQTWTQAANSVRHGVAFRVCLVWTGRVYLFLFAASSRRRC